MIRTLVSTVAELVMVMSIVLLDWLIYVSSPALPSLSTAGCLGSIGSLVLSELNIAATSVMLGRSAGSS
ncbi:hypothetical protein ACQJBY_070021 [Aegilops geniculata]